MKLAVSETSQNKARKKFLRTKFLIKKERKAFLAAVCGDGFGQGDRGGGCAGILVQGDPGWECGRGTQGPWRGSRWDLLTETTRGRGKGEAVGCSPACPRLFGPALRPSPARPGPLSGLTFAWSPHHVTLPSCSSPQALGIHRSQPLSLLSFPWGAWRGSGLVTVPGTCPLDTTVPSGSRPARPTVV